ncbi:MAG: hypothetical protein AABW87_03050 [Nanoarchaeota archaeon]
MVEIKKLEDIPEQYRPVYSLLVKLEGIRKKFGLEDSFSYFDKKSKRTITFEPMRFIDYINDTGSLTPRQLLYILISARKPLNYLRMDELYRQSGELEKILELKERVLKADANLIGAERGGNTSSIKAIRRRKRLMGALILSIENRIENMETSDEIKERFRQEYEELRRSNKEAYKQAKREVTERLNEIGTPLSITL